MSHPTSPMRAANSHIPLEAPSTLLAALVVVAFTLLGVAGPSNAASAEEPAPTVEQILEAHVKALGGKAAIENVKSISRTGDLLFESAFSGSIEGRLELDILPKQKIYRAAELGAFSTTTAWNGEKAWEIGPQGQRELMPWSPNPKPGRWSPSSSPTCASTSSSTGSETYPASASIFRQRPRSGTAWSGPSPASKSA